MENKRLINADALMERFRIVAQSGGAVTHHVSDICAAIEDEAVEEGVDAVEVVRCKDCKHFAPCEEIEGVSWTGFCNYGVFHTDEDDFCSRGERRTDNG